MKLYDRYEKFMGKYNLFKLQELGITQGIQIQFWDKRTEVKSIGILLIILKEILKLF